MTRTSLFLAALLTAPAGAVELPTYPTRPDNAVTTNEWAVDRFPPRGFVNAGTQFGRDNVLRVTLDAGDGLPNRPPPFNSTFYNTQGRVVGMLNTPPGTAVTGSLYLPQAWTTTDPGSPALNRTTTLLLELSPFADFSGCPNGECVVYPGIGFTNADINNPLTNGGVPRIRVLDKETSANGWVNLATPFQTNAWNDFCIAWEGPRIRYYVNGQLVYTDNTVVQPVPNPTPIVGVRKTFIQAYNYTTNYDIHWSRLEYGAQSNLSLTATAGTAIAGQPFTVTWTVGNSGPQAASNIRLPLNLVGAQLQTVSGACTSLPCTIANLAVGASATVSATYLATATAGSTITANPRLTSDSVDCVPADNQLALSIPVQTAAPAASTPVPVDDRRALALLLAAMLVAGTLALRRR
jgi:hypothetical protein